MGTLVNDEEKIKVGKLNLVDLAGSERQTKTGYFTSQSNMGRPKTARVQLDCIIRLRTPSCPSHI